jgi:CBS domain-containing protein
MTWPQGIDRLRAADVVHRRLTTTPAATTVGELRAYFAESGSRRMALVVDGARYLGAIEAAALPADVDGAEQVGGHAVPGPTIAPGASAEEARQRAIAEPSRRIAVVDDDGRLLGIVAVTRTLDAFCGMASDA